MRVFITCIKCPSHDRVEEIEPNIYDNMSQGTIRLYTKLNILSFCLCVHLQRVSGDDRGREGQAEGGQHRGSLPWPRRQGAHTREEGHPVL
jgi:hypothetical protein